MIGGELPAIPLPWREGIKGRGIPAGFTLTYPLPSRERDFMWNFRSKTVTDRIHGSGEPLRS